MLDTIGAAAYVRNGRMDILAANRLGRALYSEIFDTPRRPPNSARFAFLDRRAPDFFVDWNKVADDDVAVLRAEAGRDPYDRDLNDIGELSTQSEDFRVLWAKHDVRYHDTGIKRLHHPIVGELELGYEVMTLAANEELTTFVYTAEPRSSGGARKKSDANRLRASDPRYPLRMTLLRPRVDELLPVPAVAPRPPFVHVPA
jgi:hypothetical protein